MEGKEDRMETCLCGSLAMMLPRKCLETERRELSRKLRAQAVLGYLPCHVHVARDEGLGLSAWLGFYIVLGNDHSEVATLECSTVLGALARLWRISGGGAQHRGLLSTSQSSSYAPLTEPHSPLSPTTKGARSS